MQPTGRLGQAWSPAKMHGTQLVLRNSRVSLLVPLITLVTMVGTRRRQEVAEAVPAQQLDSDSDDEAPEEVTLAVGKQASSQDPAQAAQGPQAVYAWCCMACAAPLLPLTPRVPPQSRAAVGGAAAARGGGGQGGGACRRQGAASGSSGAPCCRSC